MNSLNDKVYEQISQNDINSIFELGDNYDSVINQESRGASDQTLYYLYRKCY